MTTEEIFEILTNRRRRLVLAYLRDQGGTTALNNVAEHIASLENNKPVDQLSSAERKRVYIGLYQGHLPTMDEYGVVDWDKPRGTIEVRPESEPAYRLLDAEFAEGDDDRSGPIPGPLRRLF